MNTAMKLFTNEKLWVAALGAAITISTQFGFDKAKADSIRDSVMTIFSAVILAMGMKDHGTAMAGGSDDDPSATEAGNAAPAGAAASNSSASGVTLPPIKVPIVGEIASNAAVHSDGDGVTVVDCNGNPIVLPPGRYRLNLHPGTLSAARQAAKPTAAPANVASELPAAGAQPSSQETSK